MKIILSRKGFDTSSGGVPSPIFSDGQLLSLPIPDSNSPITYGDISWNGKHLGNIVSDLTNGRMTQSDRAHLDPDLVFESFPRKPGWRPILGQVNSAQSHLRNQFVGVGDIFLFFGLFREIEDKGSSYRFSRLSSPKHVLWGWLQIGQTVPVDNCPLEQRAWADYHPHFHQDPNKTNTLYIANERLDLAGQSSGTKGAGVFRQFSEALQLTASESKKPSLWRLPIWFYPNGNPPLTYRGNPDSWSLEERNVLLQTVGRGQEFVLDTIAYPKAIPWLASLFSLSE